jgi:hypothetical protein
VGTGRGLAKCHGRHEARGSSSAMVGIVLLWQCCKCVVVAFGYSSPVSVCCIYNSGIFNRMVSSIELSRIFTP